MVIIARASWEVLNLIYWFKIPGVGDVTSLNPMVRDAKIWTVVDLKEIKAEGF